MQYFRGNTARIDRDRIYREHLKKSHARKGDSEQALSNLVPLLERLEGAGAAERMGSASPSMVPAKPQVMIDSAVAGADITFDGRPAGKLPFVKEVAPGKHRFTVSKPGYEDYTRELTVNPKTGVPPFDVPLIEKPAVLSIDAPEGAEVSIDGRPQGDAPLPPPARRHFVAFVETRPYTREINLRGRAG
jgi:hypothetical protein